MIVASFYAPREDKWGCDYMEILGYLQDSCDKYGLRHVVISDRQIGDFECAVYDLPKNLMQAILYGQMKCLEEFGDVLLVGADCVFTKDPRGVRGEHDIAVTVHSFGDCWLNTGAIWATDKCAFLWQQALIQNPRKWGDDQIALRKTLDPVPSTEGEGERQGLMVKFLPCKQYNWAPTSPNDRCDAMVVHFRGLRKAWQKDWVDKWQ